MDIIDETVQKIKSLEIQGATAIVTESLKALKIWLSENPNAALDDFQSKTEKLKNARPTEPYIHNVFTLLMQFIKVKGINEGIKIISEIEEKIAKTHDLIVENGTDVLKDKKIFLTHCHAKSVEKILLKLHEMGIKIKVFATKTEPLRQGELTAKHLADAGIDVTLITDSEAAFLVSKEDNQGIDAVVIGADALLSDGSIINKVGSFGISLSAYTYGIPVFISASLLKYSSEPVVVEVRDGKEIWSEHPENVKIENPAFDKVPAEYITGIITEAGVIESIKIAAKVKEVYPVII